MGILNYLQLLFTYLPNVLRNEEITEDQFLAITGQTYEGFMNNDGQFFKKKYDIVYPDVYAKGPLTWVANGIDILMNENTERNQGVISLDKGTLKTGEFMLATHVLFGWDTKASSSAGDAIYKGDKSSIPGELANATVMVLIGTRVVHECQVSEFLSDAASTESKGVGRVALASPHWLNHKSELTFQIKYQSAGAGLSALTDTYGMIGLDGPRMINKS